jgi:hypothetical protein
MAGVAVTRETEGMVFFAHLPERLLASLVQTFVIAGVKICLTSPGTPEMHLIAAAKTHWHTVNPDCVYPAAAATSGVPATCPGLLPTQQGHQPPSEQGC